MDIYLYYGNHNEGIKSISDILNIVKSSLNKTHLIDNFIYSEKIIHNEVNIIVEEFSNREFCEELLSIKRIYPKTRYILFITEVPINGTYNLFNSGLCIFLLPAIYLQKIFRYFHFLRHREKSVTLKYLKGFNLCLPSIHNFVNLDCLPSTLNYFHSRYLGTKYLISKEIFTKIYNLNNSAKHLTDTSFNCDSIEFPYIADFVSHHQKNNLIFFSGTINKQRRRNFKKLGALDIKLNHSLNDNTREELCKNSLYTLHMPRYESPDANYSSPTRTLHALKYGTLTVFYCETQLSDFEKFLNLPCLKTSFKSISNNIAVALDDYYYEQIDDINKRISTINEINRKELIAEFSTLK